MKNCKACQKEIPSYKDPRNIYCSSVCSNRTTGKSLEKIRICQCGNLCDKTAKGNPRYKCQKCLDSSKIKNKSVKDVLGKGANRFNKIRHDARRVLESNNIDKCCSKCGYNKHVEVCHLKPISAFSLQELVSVVNSITNLVYLCPNHHWELDNL